jgi:hypothetical protein
MKAVCYLASGPAARETDVMRVHSISLALRYLQGRRTIRAAPYYGKSPFSSDAEAAKVLRDCTGQDFGEDAKKWSEWLRKNRWVYYRSPE